MWWKSQNLNKPIQDPSGHTWHFQVWHDSVDQVYIQRIFFWDEDYNETGMMELRGDQTIDHKKIKQRMLKIASDPEYRKPYARDLSFPLERFYNE